MIVANIYIHNVGDCPEARDMDEETCQKVFGH